MAMKYLPNLLLAGIALASFYSCEYDTFKDMQPENVNPTLVAPLINDTLTIGDLVQREGEKSTVNFGIVLRGVLFAEPTPDKEPHWGQKDRTPAFS